MNGKSTFEMIKSLMVVAASEGDKFYDGNKAAGVRARKALDEVAKLKFTWRKETMYDMTENGGRRIEK